MSSSDRSSVLLGHVSRRWFLRTLAVGGGTALLAACQSAAAPSPTVKPAEPAAKPTTAAAVNPAEGAAKPAEPAAAAAKPSGSADWDELQRLAKQDGEVVIFLGRAASRQVRPVFGEFEKRFGVKATSVVGSGGENADRIIAERDAGLYTADIWMGGSTSMNTRLVPKNALDPIDPILVLPEVTDRSVWWSKKHLYGDKDSKLIFMFAASPTSYLAYNTQMADPSEITSWWDLLNPKWKGKILSRDPTQSGTGVGLLGFYFSPLLGPDFLRRLYTEQDVAVTRDGRQGAEWLALGKYPWYFIPSGNDPREAKDQGLPVDEIIGSMKEGTWISSGGTGTIGMINKAAHPNAAKLFVNWWLSKEAQLLYMKQNPEDESLREDISKDDMLPQYRRQPGVEYIHLDSNPEWLGRDGEANEYMKGVLAGKV